MLVAFYYQNSVKVDFIAELIINRYDIVRWLSLVLVS